VLALLAERKVDRFWLGGFSYGGYVAFELVRKANNRLLGLLLCDTKAEADSSDAKQGRMAFIEKVQGSGSAALAETMLPKLLTKRHLADDPVLTKAVRSVILKTSPQGGIQALRGMMERPDSRATLSTIRVPTLIVVGAQDEITPPEAAKAMQKAIPNSTLRIVEGAAHLVPLEAPEALHPLLGAWIHGTLDQDADVSPTHAKT
jgi:3-oxoadipate enol-lactonase